MIQAKLNVGPVDDPLEREADRVARLATGASPSLLAQRAPAAVRHVPAAAGGAADPAVTRAVERARGGGLEVPGGVRDRMERTTGADFGSVRLHVGSESDRLNDALGSRAFTVGADVFVRRSEYRPGTARGDALLGHELAHTVQQGAAGPGRGDTSTVTAQRYVEIDPDDADYPTKHGENAEDPEFFQSQYESEHSFYEKRALRDGTSEVNRDTFKANIRYSQKVPLRFSDDFELAVESRKEAKVFFATQKHVDAANATFDELGGMVRFQGTGKFIRVKRDGNEYDLLRVIPVEQARVRRNVPGRFCCFRARTVESLEPVAGGNQVRSPQSCEHMAAWVTGTLRKADLQRRHARILAEILDGASESVGPNRKEFTEWVDRGEDVDGLHETMVQRYRELMQKAPEALAAAEEKLGVNDYVKSPDVGATLAIANVFDGDSLYRANEAKKKKENARKEAGKNRDLRPWSPDTATPFPYHFAGVVAKSGGDFITMENYARDDDYSTQSMSANDPLFYFFMYGTDNRRGDTWHRYWVNTGSFWGVQVSTVFPPNSP
ncbi:DUF4157 domain-containing protein [Streptomyces sp. ADMS]|uniref:eCIS core domain-containing protein n=1 Tax=Streptomyces sp. ADMS TaxID=3071415 RepID=UPI00296E82C5|nr:DUF4157 domain-containing protein [Streptomyces sp. ADMS]MDW4910539.1 DUF4157 domain-containing protein [Streptomyces sp. ADMS]